MANVPLATFQFLQTAAQQYATLEPTLSAHLNRQSEQEWLEPARGKLKRRKDESKDICAGCGTLLVLGTTMKESEVKMPKRKKSKLKSLEIREISVNDTDCLGSVKRECQVCYRYRQIPVSSSANNVDAIFSLSQRSSHEKGGTGSTSSMPARISSHIPVTSNASSRQRAKTRRQGALSALVAKSKAATNDVVSDGAFDLMDFMKQG